MGQGVVEMREMRMTRWKVLNSSGQTNTAHGEGHYKDFGGQITSIGKVLRLFK